MLNRLKSFLKAIWENIWPTRKEILVNGKTIEESKEAFRVKLEKYKRDRECLSKIISSLHDEGYYDFECYYENGMYHIAVPNRITGNIFACVGFNEFFMMYKLVMLKWGYKRTDLKEIESCSEQSVILPKMDEIYEHK